MAKKKEETVEEETDVVAAESAEKESDEKAEKVTKTQESKGEDSNDKEAKAEPEDNASLIDSVVDAVSSAAEVVAETASDVANAVTETASDVVNAITGSNNTEDEEKTGKKRAEKVGIVFSDKMTKTVVVRVNRMVKHQLYHKYMKRRKKFMAHDEMGAAVGDRVRIQETRPMSARKRWRVIEIIQKAEK